jgi:SAM-dependent methyltransferase
LSAQFDAYKDGYREAVQDSIAFIGQEMEFFTELKASHLLHLAETRLGHPASLRVLDVGCGGGLTDRLLEPHVGELYGVDVSAGLLERAESENPRAHYRHYDGKTLPFADGELDLAFAICVLHHVARPDRLGLIREMARVVRPGGLVAIYEHNPLNPLTRMAVRRCEFDAGVVLLRRDDVARLMTRADLTPVLRDYIVFFPLRSALLSKIEHALRWLPLGGQHCVAARK